MALTVSSMNSSSFQTLFSGLNKNNAYTTFLSDYTSIRNGSYHKLMKSYYSMDTKVDKVTTNKKEDSDQVITKKNQTLDLAQIKSTAKDLMDASNALLEQGKDNLFTKNKEGAYQVDNIYQGVADFVDSYNDMISSQNFAMSSGMKSVIYGMETLTTNNQVLLDKIGISIQKDQTLSIDQEAFRNSDMNLVKTMFQTKGGYASQIGTKASSMEYYAMGQMSAGNYNQAGAYTGNVLVGSAYQGFF